MTYPEPRISRFISENFIPVQVNVAEHPEYTDRFHERWTPSIILIDPNGVEHKRQSGYSLPEDFIVELKMGLAQIDFDNKNYEEAIKRYEDVAENHSDSYLAPEALYMVGVSKYRATGDGSHLDTYWDEVMERYPDSKWAKAGDV